MVSEAKDKLLYTNNMISTKRFSEHLRTVSTAPWLQFWAGAHSEAAVNSASGHYSDHRNIPLLCAWVEVDLHSDVFNQFTEPFPSQL